MIENSSTYVIDLDSLQDPDDVKKDNFGVWKYTGSHVNDFQCRIMESGKVKVGKGVLSSSDKYEQFSLRRLYSTHPTNSKFRRMLAFITGKYKHHY